MAGELGILAMVVYFINKIMINFFWVMFIHYAIKGQLLLFGIIIAVLSFLNMISNIMYYTSGGGGGLGGENS